MTLEQHGFELCGSNYMQIFFSEYIPHYTIRGCLVLWTWSCVYGGPTVVLEHGKVLVSAAALECIPLRYRRTTVVVIVEGCCCKYTSFPYFLCLCSEPTEREKGIQRMMSKVFALLKLDQWLG